MINNKFILLSSIFILLIGCPMPPDDSNFPQNGNISAENPSNLQYFEDINNVVNIY